MSESCGNSVADQEALMPRRRKYDKSKTCVKCKENPGNIVIRHAVYCKSCFIPLMTFKFRRALEPYVNAKPDGPRRTALKPQGNLLIGFSGGMGSTVLLDLIHRYYVAPDKALITDEGGSHHPRNERVWKRVIVCYVEVCDAFTAMEDNTNEIRDVVEHYGDMEFVPLRIQDAFDSSWWKSIGRDAIPLMTDLLNEDLHMTQLPEGKTPLESMRSHIASLPTPTARSTSLQTLSRVLVQYTALANECSHLVLGTSLTSLAVSLISGIAYGGGFHVKEDIQEEWNSDQDMGSVPDAPKKDKTRKHGLRIIRPLRDIGMKECGAWTWWMGLKVVGRQGWDWPGAKPGIGSLTKAFIVGLEKDYPSTVSTIVRTCGKLAPKGSVSGKCVSCERPVQTGSQEWRARISLRTRETTSRPTLGNDAIVKSLASHLCYTCQTTFTSRSSRPASIPYPDFNVNPTATPLPIWIGRSPRPQGGDVLEDGGEEFTVFRPMGRGEMRDVVKDFLLTDE